MPRKRRTRHVDTGRTGNSGPDAGAPAVVTEPGKRSEKIYPRAPVHPGLRLYAASVDWFIIITIVIFLRVATDGLVYSGQDTAVQDIILFFTYWVLPTGFWGQTPGKWVAGIIVIDQDGRVPGVAQAIPREMVGRVVSVAAFLLGILWLLRDPLRQGWHDKIAGTYVVRKGDTSAPGPFKMFGRRGGRKRD